jgi:hypothetical protein
MEHRDGLAVGRVQHWRPAMVPAVATGLLLLERVLPDQMGSPVTLLRALGDLGQPWTDPVASVLAVMALTAETLVGHARGAGARVDGHAAWLDGSARRPAHVADHPGCGPAPARPAHGQRAARPDGPGRATRCSA